VGFNLLSRIVNGGMTLLTTGNPIAAVANGVS